MAVTPDFAGQIYKDTATGNLWRANSTTPGDWTLELQNSKLKWEPKSETLSEVVGFYTYSTLTGITSFTFLGAHSLIGFDLEQPTPIDFSAPNLIDIDPTAANGGFTTICASSLSMPLLETTGDLLQLNPSFSTITTLSLPSFVTCNGSLNAQNIATLTSVDCPSLVTSANGFTFSGCSSLATVNFPVLLPSNGKNLNFSGCALNIASVNQILARCVANAAYISGTVNISGGTSAAPPTGGGTDHDILVARGVTVTHN